MNNTRKYLFEFLKNYLPAAGVFISDKELERVIIQNYTSISKKIGEEIFKCL